MNILRASIYIAICCLIVSIIIGFGNQIKENYYTFDYINEVVDNKELTNETFTNETNNETFTNETNNETFTNEINEEELIEHDMPEQCINTVEQFTNNNIDEQVIDERIPEPIYYSGSLEGAPI